VHLPRTAAAAPAVRLAAAAATGAHGASIMLDPAYRAAMPRSPLTAPAKHPATSTGFQAAGPARRTAADTDAQADVGASTAAEAQAAAAAVYPQLPPPPQDMDCEEVLSSSAKPTATAAAACAAAAAVLSSAVSLAPAATTSPADSTCTCTFKQLQQRLQQQPGQATALRGYNVLWDTALATYGPTADPAATDVSPLLLMWGHPDTLEDCRDSLQTDGLESCSQTLDVLTGLQALLAQLVIQSVLGTMQQL
jgi:hypothetical protein